MARKVQEQVMQILTAVVVVVAIGLFSANPVVADKDEDLVGITGTPPIRNSAFFNAQNHIVTLTQKEVETVTLTLPPLTVTETSTLTAKEINLRAISKTAQINNMEPAVIKSNQEISRNLDDCLRDMSSILTECIAKNSVRQVDDKTMIVPTTVWMSTTIAESPVTVTRSVTETVLVVDSSTPLVDQTIVTVTAGTVPSDAIISNADVLIDALSSLVVRISDIYPFVDEMDQKVLDSLKPLADAKTVQTQLKKLPENQSGALIHDMLKLTNSINGMVEESAKYKRVVPVNLMGSVKRLIRYLNRLIKF